MSVKTKAVEIKGTSGYSGVEGRGIKLSLRNFLSVSEWIGERAEAIYKPNSDKPDTNQRVKIKTLKGVRVARPGDYVVKLGKDHFVVIKKDDVETNLVVK